MRWPHGRFQLLRSSDSVSACLSCRRVTGPSAGLSDRSPPATGSSKTFSLSAPWVSKWLVENGFPGTEDALAVYPASLPSWPSGITTMVTVSALKPRQTVPGCPSRLPFQAASPPRAPRGVVLSGPLERHLLLACSSGPWTASKGPSWVC